MALPSEVTRAKIKRRKPKPAPQKSGPPTPPKLGPPVPSPEEVAARKAPRTKREKQARRAGETVKTWVQLLGDLTPYGLADPDAKPKPKSKGRKGGGLATILAGIPGIGDELDDAANAVGDAVGTVAKKAPGFLGKALVAGTPSLFMLRGKPREIVEKGAKDIFDLPVQIPAGLYETGAAGFEAAKGDTKRAKTMLKGLTDESVLGQLLYHGEALDALKGKKPDAALKLADAHPGFSALEFTGLGSAAGRLGGAGARLTPKLGREGSTINKVTTKVRDAGSTQREPLRAPDLDLGDGHVVRSPVAKTRHFSKNILTKGLQVSADNVKRRRGIDPNVMKRGEADRYFRRRMSAVGQMNEVLRRQGRQEAKDIMAQAEPGRARVKGRIGKREINARLLPMFQGKHTNLLGLLGQRVIRSPETLRDDLIAFRQGLIDIRGKEELSPFELRENAKLVKSVEAALRDEKFMADPGDWFDAARTYIVERTKADQELKKLGLLTDGQEAAKQLPALMTHFDVEHNPHRRVDTETGALAAALRESVRGKEQELRSLESKLANRRLHERKQTGATDALERRGKALPGDEDVKRVRAELRDLQAELARATRTSERHARSTGKLEGVAGERTRLTQRRLEGKAAEALQRAAAAAARRDELLGDETPNKVNRSHSRLSATVKRHEDGALRAADAGDEAGFAQFAGLLERAQGRKKTVDAQKRAVDRADDAAARASTAGVKAGLVATRTGRDGRGDFMGDADLEATWGLKDGEPNGLRVEDRNGRVSVEAFDSEGKMVGRLVFDSEGTAARNLNVVTHSTVQRNGVASALYRRAEEAGFKVREGQTAKRSPEGQAFRESADHNARIDAIAAAAKEVTPDDFEASFARALEDPKQAPFLSRYSPEERAQQTLIMSKDGMAGAAVKADGDIVSVFRLKGAPKGSGVAMVRAAIERGGNKLNAIGEKLRSIYEGEGFVVTKKVDWDDDFAPDGWDYAANGRPPIYFMAYDGRRGAAGSGHGAADATPTAAGGAVGRADAAPGGQPGDGGVPVRGADVPGLGRGDQRGGAPTGPLANLSPGVAERHASLLGRLMDAYEQGGKQVDHRRVLRDAVRDKQRELVAALDGAKRVTPKERERLDALRAEIRDLEAQATSVRGEVAGHQKALKQLPGKEKWNPRFFLDGEPVTIAAGRRMLEDIGIDPDEIGFLSHNPRAHGARAYHQTWDKRPDMAQGRRTGETFRRGAADSSWQAMTDDLAGAFGKVDAAKSWDRAAREFGQGLLTGRDSMKRAQAMLRDAGLDEDYRAVRITPLRAGSGQVEKILEQLGRGDAGDFSTHDVGTMMQQALDAATDPKGSPHGPVMIVPSAALREWASVSKGMASTDAIKAFQVLSQNFRRVVLPFSTRWLAGNFVEAGFRSLLYGHGPFDLLRGVKALKMLGEYDAKHGTDYQAQLIARTLGGRLYGSHARDKLHRGAAQFSKHGRIQQAAHVGGVAARLPVARQLLGGMRKLQDSIFGFNEWLEDQFVTASIGAHVRHEIVETNQSISQMLRVGNDAIREYVEKGLTNTNKQVEFAERVDEVLGRYSRHSAGERHMIQTFTPFWDWYRNAMVFVFHTLPVKHPIKTALLTALTETLTDDLTAQGNVGIARTSDLPAFLRGTVLDGDGNRVQLQRYLPFGALANPGGSAFDLILPQISGFQIATGINWKGQKASMADGEDPTLLKLIALAGYQTLENQTPGASLLRRALEGGATGFDDSTIFHPRVKEEGDKRQGGELLRKLFDPFVGLDGKPAGGPRKKKKASPLEAINKAVGGGASSDPVGDALRKAGL